MKSYQLLLVILVLTPASAAQSLPPEVRLTAGIIGVADTLDQLEALLTQPPSTETTIRGLVLRQHITEVLLEADLDVDAVVVSIQREEAQVEQAQDRLSSRRDRVVGLTNVASIVAGSSRVACARRQQAPRPLGSRVLRLRGHLNRATLKP